MADHRLREFADLREARVETDNSNLVIRDAVLLGPVSKNSGPDYRSRQYTADAMRSGVTLYEGARGYYDHATIEDDELRGGNRSVDDFAGVWRNVRFDESQTKLRGDFHIVDDDRGRRLADIVSRFPDNSFGFSHDAAVSGSVEESSQTLVINRIRSVNSVDVVDRPATTRSFFEQETKPSKDQEDLDVTDTKAVEARVQAEAERDAAKAENETLRRELEESRKAEGVAKTATLVETLLKGKADPVAKRVRDLFDGQVADKEKILGAIENLEEFAREVQSDDGNEVDEDSTEEYVPRLDRKPDELPSSIGLEIGSLAESTFGRLCGVELNSNTEGA